ncbi:DUF998 domain-containing protein [Microlunatus speluncae]|uniref:DUF998 domain-containing protein n=1 Tax=Microlunatus speluncae TaxID=2594267 RepID=UPI0012665CBD|nr:DUF998 domain-containing protein [Microlunatus speluncae]
MSTQFSPAAAASATDPAAGAPRRLLLALVIANPLWVATSLIQAATRPGFDLTQQPLSLLSSGGLGWIQISNFVIAGLLVVAGAFGLRRTVPSRWAPRWVLIYGLGYVLSGAFTLEDQLLPHLIVGIIAFIAIAATLITLARHLARTGHRLVAVLSVIAAAFVIGANVATTIGLPYPSLVLAIGVGTGMIGVSLATATILRGRR